MPLDIQPQNPGVVAFARRRPRERAGTRPVVALPHARRPPRSALAAATSRMMTEIVAGLASCATAARREGVSVTIPDLRRLGGWARRLPRSLWSTVSYARERARLAAAWSTIDDRTLRDIGVPPRPFRRNAQSWQYWR